LKTTTIQFLPAIALGGLALTLSSCAVDQSSTRPVFPAQEASPADPKKAPAVQAVPKKVIDDCLAALKKQIPDREMKVTSARRGEANFIVEVAVSGVPKPWRCYHDGTQCTGNEYQGEG